MEVQAGLNQHKGTLLSPRANRHLIVAMGDRAVPCQKVFLLNLLQVTETSVVLATLEGDEITIRVTWNESRRHHSFLVTGVAFTEDNSLERNQQILHGPGITMKLLGKAARRALGRSETTRLGTTVRIVSGTKPLGIHRPLATLLDAQSEHYQWSQAHCHFCGQWLQERGYEQQPFPSCYFCEDAPAWHHGWCCPHNPQSDFYKGEPHVRRYISHVKWLHSMGRSSDGEPLQGESD